MDVPSAAQRRLIERIVGVLQVDPRIAGAWLSGSLGRGTADVFSDVDVLVVTGPDPSAVAGSYLRDVDAIAATVIAQLLFGRVVSCVTPDWDRFDLAFVAEAELTRYDGRQLTCLFTRGVQPADRDLPAAPPSAFASNLTEFFRVLGLAPVGIGRGECIVMLDGIGHLRRILVETLLEYNGVTQSERGGVLKLNPFLTESQRHALATLPALAMTPQSLLEGSLALARIYVPLAKSMSAERGHPWPAALEAAARRRLGRIPGMAPPTLW